MTELSKRSRKEGYLGEWRSPLIDEPLKPSQRSLFKALRIARGEQLAERERIG